MKVKISFTNKSWEEYTSWIDNRKILKRINKLIDEIKSNPVEGIGKPEPLKYNLAGFWSRRIDDEHRLVYTFNETEVVIISCRYHYEK
ncbi:hypothetical protein A6A19_08890 [Actinobacillus delphinicola]|uniref:Txe/YoeB family addiction module toxin n=1 Tax=Actinobacillus delphinicola TaxID=51161 RepID=UPI002441C196|nr:Txe/YoeB family addiction module toxin [Actinobacillus delphinicola]MDG6898083.1 hypothetical protein [Actinobacillus delphinicola]MDG6898090.1 hypothetical protein [Actinobacillus delphinicola]